MPVFSKESIDGLTLPIDTVVSHSTPSFCQMQDSPFLREWAECDPGLLEDVKEERRTMDRIYECLLQKGFPIKAWYYGHFHASWTSVIDNIRFKMLDIMEFIQIPDSAD